MLSKLKNRFGIMAFMSITILVCLMMMGAIKKLPTLPKTEKILWVGYWDTFLDKNGSAYEYYCVISENRKSLLRTLRVYKPTMKGYKKIYSYSDYDSFLKAFSEAYGEIHSIDTYWVAGSGCVYRVFECDPAKDKVEMTFETGYTTEPERLYEDNGDAYLLMGDEESSFWTEGGTLSYETALFYKRVPGNGYSKFTTCKWDDRYSMMGTISKSTTANK